VALQQLGRFREAEAIAQDVRERRSRQQGDGYQDTLNARLLHAALLWQLGRLAEAESQCRQVAEAPTAVACLGDATVRSVRITHADSGCGSVDAFAARLNRALMLEKLGRLTEAEAELRAAVPGLAAALGEAAFRTFLGHAMLGSVLTNLGRLDEAAAETAPCRPAVSGRLGHPRAA
jgi:eukaryotic-like serine/threonine-protein kinase